VDIAIEFSRLILAQRGFQVNSRTISAANETLQELANIIR
jgi:flagellar hook protein FlgE